MDQMSQTTNIPLKVDVNLDPIGENVRPLGTEGNADNKHLQNTGYHSEDGVANLRRIEVTDGNTPEYSYITEDGQVIEILDGGTDSTTGLDYNKVYLDGKLIDNVPKYGVESVLRVNGGYDDVIEGVDGELLGMRVTSPVGSSTYYPHAEPPLVSDIRPYSQSPYGVWHSVGFGNNTWMVATGSTTSSSNLDMRIRYSTNGGQTWMFSTTTIAYNHLINRIKYGNGVWIAVGGTSTTAGGVIYRSTDNGVTWTLILSGLTYSFSDVAYGENVWIATYRYASTTSIYRSTDNGASWSTVTLGSTPGGVLTGIAYSGLSTWAFVASSTSTTLGMAYSTDNGISWTFKTITAPGSGWNSITGNESGGFVAVAASTSSTASVIYFSSSTYSYITVTSPATAWQRVVYGNGIYVFLTASITVSASVAMSSNITEGVKYLTMPQALSVRYYDAAFGDSQWMIVSESTTYNTGIMQSFDNFVSIVPMPWTYPFQNVVDMKYRNGVWIAIDGSSTTSFIMRSDNNGASWSLITPSSTLGSVACALDGYGSNWVIAASVSSSTTSVIYSHDNGLTWAAGTLPITPAIGLLAVLAVSNVFIALNDSTTYPMLRSVDGGKTWATVGITFGSSLSWYNNLSCAYGDGVIVAACNDDGTYVYAWVSRDYGLTWVNTRVSYSTVLVPVYNNGIWLLTVSGTTASSYYYSNDGATTWTLISSTTIPRCYSGNGLFVTSTGYYSTDGLTWTERTDTYKYTALSFGNGVWAGVSTHAYGGIGNIVYGITPSSDSTLTIDHIDSSTGDILSTDDITLSNLGYHKSISLVRQVYMSGTDHQFLIADTPNTYNIVDSSSVAQLSTSISDYWNGTPYQSVVKIASSNDYMLCVSGATPTISSGIVTAPSSYNIRQISGSSAPYNNYNHMTAYSWIMMQTKDGYNRVIATGNTNPGSTQAEYWMIYGNYDFSSNYLIIPSYNSIASSTDYENQVSSSGPCYFDIVHTDYNHYYSGVIAPSSDSVIQVTPNSVNSIMSFGRLSWVTESDYGAIPQFEFRLNMVRTYGSEYGTIPVMLSVGIPYSKDGQNVAIGTPISTFGEIDPSYVPQLGSSWDTIMWRYNGVYYRCKISDTPIRMIQKITSKLYKINTISPINVLNADSGLLTLGSNDYVSSTLVSSSTAIATPVAAFTASKAEWSATQDIAANTIDIGGVAAYYETDEIDSLTILPLAAFVPPMHLRNDYYYLQQYAGTGQSANSVISAYRSDGLKVTSSVLSTTFQNQLISLGVSYVSNTTLAPLPLGIRFAGYTIGTNSSATSASFLETFVTSGYHGTELTIDWDGYIVGNQISKNAVSFALFNQPYLFDGDNIYKMTVSSGGVSLPLTVMARANGLQYMTTSPSLAFFFSPFDNSIWTFDGGYTLSKLDRLDGIGAIEEGQFSTYNSSLWVLTGSYLGDSGKVMVLTDGLWSAIPRPTLLVPDSNESYPRMYNTPDGVIFGNTDTWYNWKYYNKGTVGSTTSNGLTTVNAIEPLTLQTGYIGVGNNHRMNLSGITFAVYNENKSKITVDITVTGYDQDRSMSSEVLSFVINPTDYLFGGLYRGRVQPRIQKYLAASVTFECDQDVRIFDLQYHWIAGSNATISPARSQ